jgi:hypothetical protein
VKRLIAVCLPTVLISATIAVLPTQAEVVRPELTISQVGNNNISPFNLTFLAYQGYLESEGIPSAGALIQKVQLKEIDAKQIVEAAIRSKRLTPDTLNDRGYLYAVNIELTALALTNE